MLTSMTITVLVCIPLRQPSRGMLLLGLLPHILPRVPLSFQRSPGQIYRRNVNYTFRRCVFNIRYLNGKLSPTGKFFIPGQIYRRNVNYTFRRYIFNIRYSLPRMTSLSVPSVWIVVCACLPLNSFD